MKSRKSLSLVKLCCIFIFALVLLNFVGSVNASEPSAMFRGIRPIAMGGTFIAAADDQNAFFYNPAGLGLRNNGFLTLFELPITISKDTYALYQYYNDNKDALKDFDQQTEATKQKIMSDIVDRIALYRIHLTFSAPNVNFVTGPIQLANGNNVRFGVGLFDLIDVKLKVNAGLLVPNLNLTGNADVVGIVPIVYQWKKAPLNLPGKLSLGTNLKCIMRGRLDEQRRSILELDNYDPAFQKGTGIGADLGMLYEINDQWNAGMMISDFGGTVLTFAEATSSGITTPSFSDVIKPRVNIGAAFKPNKFYYWPGKYWEIGNKHLSLVADLNNITDTEGKLFDETFFMKLHVGAELKWKMIAFRGGFNQGYPTLGVGLYLLFLKLDYAYYVDELGKYAGTLPEANHMFTVAFRF
ncbi:MAG: DUF5723 family protein [bacterium]